MELRNWLILNNACYLSQSSLVRLLEHFGGVHQLCQAKWEELINFKLNKKAVHELQHPDEDLIKWQLRWGEQDGQHILTLENLNYPTLLKSIPDPPPVLFVRGNPGLLERPQIAVVGSRNPSPGGIRAAMEFAMELARAGWAITSGLATGIDAAGHRGALNVGGTTLSVLGSGLDVIYPYKHRGLAEEIAQTGALISEFSPGCAPLAGHFPQRNRLISGLSLGVCVVEATKRSGSLITAKLALDQGREVFAVPGSIFNHLSSGCHSLIQEGSYLVTSAEDILSVLKQATSAWGLIPPSRPGKEIAPKGLELDYNCHKLLQWIGFEATAIDQIVHYSGYSVPQVTEHLISLELAGCIRSVPGGYVRYR